jgi:signal peptidase I
MPTQPDTAVAGTETQEDRSRWHTLREVVETILLTLVIFVVINTFTGRFRIEGPSMKPNLHEGQYLIINKLVYKLHPPQRGDIVVFHHPRNPGHDLVKRVIGLPGETVEVRQGQVYIDGTPLEEPYVVHQDRKSVHYELGPDDFFVLGDNRPNSDDSRTWGVLKRDQIVGKAWISYWPLSDLGGVPHHSFSKDIAAQGQGTGIGDD